MAKRKTNPMQTDLAPISAFLPGMVDGVELEQPAPKPKAITVQGKHHHTRAKQIDRLAAIGENSSPDKGFMTRLLTLCSLPRTDPGSRLQYVRKNGPFTLGMTAGVENKLPYGNLPRLLLAWLCTEVVRTQRRDLELGKSLAAFMRKLGMVSDSGGSRADRTRLRKQIDRLFNAHVQLIYQPTPGHKFTTSSSVADETELWWDYKSPTQDSLWKSRLTVGEKLFHEIIAHPVPLDMRILKAMRRSPLGLDLYMWLSYKVYSLYRENKPPERLSWHSLYRQLGSDPGAADDNVTVQSFRKDALRELRKLKLCWPELDYGTPKGSLEVRPCLPSILPVENPVNQDEFSPLKHPTLPEKTHKR